MPSASKPWWQQATALISLSAGGAVTGLSFVPKSAVDITSPSSLPINLLALQHAVRQAPGDDASLRSAIVNVARYYLKMAEGKTPAEMEAIIWQHDSLDGADHGPSCGAFASLTLALAAQVVGKQSWVTGGSSYPWPMHTWVDARVDPNPASLGITSIQQDAQAHHRWHPLGDGYRPQPGDWVLFGGHVEVVTNYAGGVLHTIGGDSLPDFSVNAHQFPEPLGAQGVVGFVDNGGLPKAAATARPGDATAGSAASATIGSATDGSGTSATTGSGTSATTGFDASSATTSAPVGAPNSAAPAAAGSAAIPGHAVTTGSPRTPATNQASASFRGAERHATAAIPGVAGVSPTPPATASPSAKSHAGTAAIPGAAPDGAGRAAPRPEAAADRPGGTDIPGLRVPVHRAGGETPSVHARAATGHSAGAGAPMTAAQPHGVPPGATSPGAAAIPGLIVAAHQKAHGSPAQPTAAYRRHEHAQAAAPVQDSATQEAFIKAVAPGAIAAQRKYGVPAAVTIAQAIEESSWGQSSLAAQDNNLFGIKGTGPAGSHDLPTQEYENGQWVTRVAPFRVYHTIAQSIDDHGKLLATSGYYTRAMAARGAPNAFATALTGVYATDPGYGAKLISLMRQHNLYRFDGGHVAGTRAAAGPATSRSSQTLAAPAQASSSPASTARGGASPTPASGTETPTVAAPPSQATPVVTTPAPFPPGQATPAAGAAAAASGPPTARRGTAGRGAAAATPRAPAQSSPAPGGFELGSAAIPGVADPAPGQGGTRAALKSATRAGLRPDAAGSRRFSAAVQRIELLAEETPAVRGTGERTAAAAPGSVHSDQAYDTGGTGGRVTAAAQHCPLPEWAHDTAPGTGPAPSGGKGVPAGHRAGPRGGSTPAAAGPQAARQPAVAVPRIQLLAEQARAAGRAQPRTAARPAVSARPGRPARSRVRLYKHDIPAPVRQAFIITAKSPLLADELLYRDVAAESGIRWELLAATDWMQCKARPGYSPVRGEKLGTVNPDGTVYLTRSAALQQCASDLVELARSVYGIDITAREPLSVPGLANVFAAFRWGGLLKLHHTSAMEFPYSVAGLTPAHLNMRWPRIDEANAPDKPGARFRTPFGAVPIVLELNYPATV